MWKRSGGWATGLWCSTWSRAGSVNSNPGNWRNCGSLLKANGASPSLRGPRRRVFVARAANRERFGTKRDAALRGEKRNLPGSADRRVGELSGKRIGAVLKSIHSAEDPHGARESGERQRKERASGARAPRVPARSKASAAPLRKLGNPRAANRIGSGRNGTGEEPAARTGNGKAPVVKIARELLHGTRNPGPGSIGPGPRIAKPGAGRVREQARVHPGADRKRLKSGPHHRRGQARGDSEPAHNSRPANFGADAREPSEAAGVMPAGRIAPPHPAAGSHPSRKRQGAPALRGTGRTLADGAIEAGVNNDFQSTEPVSDEPEFQASAHALEVAMSAVDTGCMKSSARMM